jgi:hypothetical protein
MGLVGGGRDGFVGEWGNVGAKVSSTKGPDECILGLTMNQRALVSVPGMSCSEEAGRAVWLT